MERIATIWQVGLSKRHDFTRTERRGHAQDNYQLVLQKAYAGGIIDNYKPEVLISTISLRCTLAVYTRISSSLTVGLYFYSCIDSRNVIRC